MSTITLLGGAGRNSTRANHTCWQEKFDANAPAVRMSPRPCIALCCATGRQHPQELVDAQLCHQGPGGQSGAPASNDSAGRCCSGFMACPTPDPVHVT